MTLLDLKGIAVLKHRDITKNANESQFILEINL